MSHYRDNNDTFLLKCNTNINKPDTQKVSISRSLNTRNNNKIIVSHMPQVFQITALFVEQNQHPFISIFKRLAAEQIIFIIHD